MERNVRWVVAAAVGAAATILAAVLGGRLVALGAGAAWAGAVVQWLWLDTHADQVLDAAPDHPVIAGIVVAAIAGHLLVMTAGGFVAVTVLKAGVIVLVLATGLRHAVASNY